MTSCNYYCDFLRRYAAALFLMKETIMLRELLLQELLLLLRELQLLPLQLLLQELL